MLSFWSYDNLKLKGGKLVLKEQLFKVLKGISMMKTVLKYGDHVMYEELVSVNVSEE